MTEPSVHFSVSRPAGGADIVPCEITLGALERLYGKPFPQGTRPPDIFRAVHDGAERAALDKIRREGDALREPLVICADDL